MAMLTESYRFVRRYHVIGIIILCAVASPLHFVYEWLDENVIVGLFAPISESVWEHLKLSFWPMLAWWAAGFLLYRQKHQLDPQRWFFASFFALLLPPLIVVGTFYTLEAGFHIESLILDVLMLFMAIATGQLVALQVYRYHEWPRSQAFFLMLAVTILFAVMLIGFTFAPPDFPMFISGGG